MQCGMRKSWIHFFHVEIVRTWELVDLGQNWVYPIFPSKRNFPVVTRRRFNVYKTSIRRRRRRMDVLKTLKWSRVSTGKQKNLLRCAIVPRVNIQSTFTFHLCQSSNLFILSIFVNGIGILTCFLYFLRIPFLPNNANIKIPLELRRKVYNNPNVTWSITSNWPFCSTLGICIKPISSTVPSNKNNFINILG